LSLEIAPLTLLEAVNIVLENDGETGINSYSGEGFAPAAVAERTIHEVSRRYQSKGRGWNTDIGVFLTPDPISGQIEVPLDASRVSVNRSMRGLINVSTRGGVLYDRKSNTTQFTDKVCVDIVRFLPFEDMPEDIRYYVTIAAAHLYQKRQTSSELTNGLTYEDEMNAKTEAMRFELRQDRPNMLKDNPSNAAFFHRSI
jgi:hypothetical protein